MACTPLSLKRIRHHSKLGLSQGAASSQHCKLQVLPCAVRQLGLQMSHQSFQKVCLMTSSTGLAKRPWQLHHAKALPGGLVSYHGWADSHLMLTAPNIQGEAQPLP